MKGALRAALGALLAATALCCAAPPADAARFRLVVVIVVDQLPAGRLERMQGFFTGGLRRFIDEGRRFTRCAHDHAGTETGPGHATLLSGLFPSHNGIVLNDWYDRETHRDVYCASDETQGARPGFDGSAPTSADHLKDENLADRFKRAEPASKVYAVAGKDRSAILTGGHRADGVFWFSVKSGGFTGGPRFEPSLPSWGADLWAADATATGLYAGNVPAEWFYPVRAGWGPDDDPAENPAYSRVAPHPLAAIDPDKVPASERAPTIARRVRTSPWVDWLTLQAAARILDGADLGGDDAPDLLVVGLSGVDYVGHSYGPDSQEYLDALIRIDGWLKEFMTRAGRRGPVLFALSADHGVLPLPEKVPGARRVDDGGLRERLEKGMAARLGAAGAGHFVESMHGGDVYLDRRTLERLGVPLRRAIEAARAELSGWSDVAGVYTDEELGAPAGPSAPSDPFLELYRHSHDPARSGDLTIRPCEKCLFTSQPYGTSHGSPYDYDRDVPMILLGAGIPSGEDPGACRTVDLAPTLAGLLGLSFDTPRDGRPLLGPAAVDRPGGRK